MPSGERRIQTSKQAKAAFKARGSSYVSTTERKQLARGAELLRRAERIKAQDEKKKEWGKRREEEQAKAKQDTKPLGSQRKLDKFGYQSSQFHLGKFFQVGGGQSKDEIQPDNDDETTTLAESAAAPPPQGDTLPAVPDNRPATPPSPPPADPATSPVDLSIFLDSSTQLTLDLASSPPVAAARPLHNPLSLSFSSEDGLFDDSTIRELDRAAELELELRRSQRPEPTSVPLQSPEVAAGRPAAVAGTRSAMMPPPALPRLKGLSGAGSRQTGGGGGSSGGAGMGSGQDLGVYGISAADLEWVAGCEVQLSQFG